MKKYLFLVAVVAGLGLSGCSSPENKALIHAPETPMPPIEKVVINNVDSRVYLTRIDGCQYFMAKTYGTMYTPIHKGNCDNPIHVYNKVTTTTKVVAPKIIQ